MIRKGSLAPMLRMAGGLDSSVCAYMAVQVRPGRAPAFYRSSMNGFVQSKDFVPGTRSFVSFPHFQDCLRASADSIELSVDASGIVCIDSVDGAYRNHLHVHTVLESRSGNKYHTIGEPAKARLDPAAFAGLNVDPIDMAQQPSLKDGTLLMVTQAGLVRWQAPALKGVALQPRKSFLSFACGGPADSLTISENGYWVAHKNGMVGCFSGHTFSDSTGQVFDVPGAPVAVVDAARLANALRSALVLCDRSSGKVDVSAAKGVSVRDKYGNEAVFGLGEQPLPWGRFSVSGGTASLLAGVLAQSAERDAAIQSIAPKAGGPAMRVSRGLFEVDFRTVS